MIPDLWDWIKEAAASSPPFSIQNTFSFPLQKTFHRRKGKMDRDAELENAHKRRDRLHSNTGKVCHFNLPQYLCLIFIQFIH